MERTGAAILLVALLYYVSGRLALLLALPPGYATTVWPASGIVLAAVLLLGPRVWPGIVLGSFAVNVGTSFDSSSVGAVLASIGLPLAIGGGAAMQALLGAFLVRRLTGFTSSLANESDVLRFLVLGGPVSSLVSPTVGVAAMAFFGAVGSNEIPLTWATWWVGDTIGSTIFAPLALLLFTPSSPAALRRKVSVAIPLCLTFALAVILFVQVSHREQERLELDFRSRTDAISHAFERKFDGDLDVLESLGSFCDANQRTDRREFGAFARDAIARSRSIHALTWNPRVKDSERALCIRAARLEVEPGFQILEPDDRGTLVPAARRDEYVPTFYLEPLPDRGRMLGLDAASDPDRREALIRARDTGAPAATPIRLGAENDSELGLLVFRPVYGRGEEHDRIASRRTSLTGYVSATIRLSDLIREALEDAQAEGLAVQLWDLTESAQGMLLCERPSRQRTKSPAIPGSRRESLDVEIGSRDARRAVAGREPGRWAGRAWDLRFHLDPADPSAKRSWQAWSVLAAGLLFTSLLGAFLLIVTGRSDVVEGLVARRTAELERLNSELRHEVAERARAEEQHRLSESRFAAAQQVAHLGSWEWDRLTNVVTWSDELYRIYGLAPGELSIDLEQSRVRVHPDDREFVELVFARAERDHQPFSFYHRILRPDGEIRNLHGRGEVTLDADAEVIRMHGTGQDVTELKRAEKDLAKRTAELERSNAELERFAYIASHDLQEPLRAVASHVQILEQDYQGRLDPDADESIRCAVDGARRMHDLINDYLAYSRVRIRTEPHRPAAAEEALATALKNLESTIADSRAEVSHDELPEVVGDASQLVQLFQNLIANGLKFRREDAPRVHVSAARADNAWLFSVSDNGIGIDPEHSGRIFSLFQRLHTQDRYPGTGIGLAICKKIVEHHGGRIWVESMPGMGATFRFTLRSTAHSGAVRGFDLDGAAAATAEPALGGLE